MGFCGCLSGSATPGASSQWCHCRRQLRSHVFLTDLSGLKLVQRYNDARVIAMSWKESPTDITRCKALMTAKR
ncbi:hypothetical protein ACFX2F_025343 [Malus domestica]